MPFVGNIGATLFAIGIFEAGLVAAITISSSSAYAFGEVTGRPHSLNSSLREGWPFYAVLVAAAGIAAALVLIPNAPLVLIVLIVNVIATLAMPPAVVFLLLLVNDREIMGEHANGRLGNVFGIAVTVFLVLAGLIFGITTVFPQLIPSWENRGRQAEQAERGATNRHEKQRRNDMLETRETGEHMHTTPNAPGTWVQEVLEPDQLSTAKQRFGRHTLGRRTVVLLWALRIYVLLMVFLIAFQAWNALHAGG